MTNESKTKQIVFTGQPEMGEVAGTTLPWEQSNQLMRDSDPRLWKVGKDNRGRPFAVGRIPVRPSGIGSNHIVLTEWGPCTINKKNPNPEAPGTGYLFLTDEEMAGVGMARVINSLSQEENRAWVGQGFRWHEMNIKIGGKPVVLAICHLNTDNPGIKENVTTALEDAGQRLPSGS